MLLTVHNNPCQYYVAILLLWLAIWDLFVVILGLGSVEISEIPNAA
jgi:hypothetical protein